MDNKDKQEDDFFPEYDAINFHFGAATYALKMIKANHLEMMNARKKKEEALSKETSDILRFSIDAFFFELMATFDCLLVLLNKAYDLGLPVEQVNWRSLSEQIRKQDKEKRLKGLFDRIDSCRTSGCLYEVANYRNRLAHRGRVNFHIHLCVNQESEPKYCLQTYNDASMSTDIPIADQCNAYLDKTKTLVNEVLSENLESYFFLV